MMEIYNVILKISFVLVSETIHQNSLSSRAPPFLEIQKRLIQKSYQRQPGIHIVVLNSLGDIPEIFPKLKPPGALPDHHGLIIVVRLLVIKIQAKFYSDFNV
ncbi:hypothetical protein RF11_04098 [Thelohanellus kitauei]|uniref:Uncharacterized protein n=1 Tax=Thelohanellus kitauei TaxID=669202 RepID=A0A0C2MCQ7_THEKT|nr:hypothetical protein RF11_14812 [Thelohanellus kitauei]KII65827.1 hypothetical protein RF11_04098 [Thelohanellus kitauei]